MTDICIFPIPNCVTFPGTVFPLHVFEPRYRAMLSHCMETQTPVAICHTMKMISKGKKAETLPELLNSNQATYRPYDIFSAGLPQWHETTDDGRMYFTIHIDQRYRLGSEKQLLPYSVYDCEVFNDLEPSNEEQAKNALLKEKIIHRLSVIGQHEEFIQETLNSEEWLSLSAEQFSFQLFGMIRFEADLLQQILEMNSATERLERTLTLLNQV
ncbi:MAG: LON peptidase substrate-binding domain-containing protein, partial [Oleibacter sp.]|nr:LON peptidase substrate-binding domain-containing protein [Thalassolituus sp.]